VIAIEKEKYDPSLELAFRISRVFDQPLEAIFFPEEEAQIPHEDRETRRKKAF
jgi:putative transcriptional regulator